MRRLFNTNFAPKPGRPWLGWALLIGGSLAVAGAMQHLSEKRTRLADIHSRYASALQEGREASSVARPDSASAVIAKAVEPRLFHPWAHLLRELEAVRGAGVRVVSFEHDAGMQATTMVVEASSEAPIADVLTGLAAAGGERATWVAGSIVALDAKVRVHLRRKPKS